MSERDYNACRMEAVAVFHDATSFQAAIDDLLSAGFDGVDINALAHEDTITAKLGRPYSSAPASTYRPLSVASPSWPPVARCLAPSPRRQSRGAPVASWGPRSHGSSVTSMPGISISICSTAVCCCGSERAIPSTPRRRSRSYSVTRPTMSTCTTFPSARAKRATCHRSATASFTSWSDRQSPARRRQGHDPG
jgi:hypothetical protein